jgi:hypothetical protein
MTWFVIVPLAFASLLTGVFQSLGTHWGLVRHYWVAFKLLLSVLATIVLLVNTGTISSLERLVAEGGHATKVGGLEGQLLHAGGGVLVLLATTTLAVFKPPGTTPFGRRPR